jgi:1,4-dihydroxy-2-naphthoate octaprenyltransferase
MGAAVPALAPWRAWWELARPKGLPSVLCLPAVGYGFGHWDWAQEPRRPLAMAALLGAWSALHAGALWLNADLDHDEGPVLLGRPVRVPPGTRLMGLLALLVALILGAWADPLAFGCTTLCVALAVAYSHPATAWKGHPVGGPAVNLLGYGLLSPLAGWFVADVPLTARTPLAMGLVVLAAGSAYFGAQAFQGDEDRGRGYRTLVVTHGAATCLALCRTLLLTIVATIALAATFGWFPQALLLAVPAWWPVDRHLRAWARQPGGGDADWAMGFVRRTLLAAGALVAVAFGQYLLDHQRGQGVAGRATALVFPAWSSPRQAPLSPGFPL